MEDSLSRDHHWGLRIDALMPAALFQVTAPPSTAAWPRRSRPSSKGSRCARAMSRAAGLALDSLEAFLVRTIGLDHLPRTDREWLQVPEEDILHVINGEVWHDPSGGFSAIRRGFDDYYPDPVWRRRIAHWCRYFSGMGTYALKRAILRRNDFYAATAFGKAIRWGVQLAFLLDRRYFPYDKWLMAYFARLPRLYAPLAPLVDEAVLPATSWERKLILLDAMADVLDGALVADGLICPHPPFAGSPTSGYRVLEHAYAELIQALPADLKDVIPVWDQVYLEQFHSRYVDGLDLAHWDQLLCLKEAARTAPDAAADGTG